MKQCLILGVGVAVMLTTACTVRTVSPAAPVTPVMTYSTTYVSYDDSVDAPFYMGYRNGFEPSNVYWNNYRDNRLSWGYLQ